MRQIFRDRQLNHDFDRDGYAIVPMLDETDVEQLRDLYNSNTNREFGEGFHTSFLSKDVDFKKLVYQKFAELFNNKLNECLNDYRVLFTHYLIKEPNTHFHFDLHVDATTVDESRHTAVTIWCALEDINEHNGGIFVWKSGHKFINGYRTVSVHNPVAENIRDLVKERGNESSIVLKKGEAIIMDQKLPHGSMPNVTGNRRIAAGLHLVPKDAECIMCFEDKDHNMSVYKIIDDDFYLNGFAGEDSKESSKLEFKSFEMNNWSITSFEDINESNPNVHAENIS
ncbi:MAG: hypothetical protein COB85_04560 [Bacteroidetes bacterium]|nr:MAG: hypothetical protein COB85_04560 [Bacteroidota bacterium]